VTSGQETYDQIGTVQTRVYVPPAEGLVFINLPPVNTEARGWTRVQYTADKVLKTVLVWSGFRKGPHLSHTQEG
jgi:hypothetical protein